MDAHDPLASLKPYFARSLAGAEGRVHLAAHSHHLWPDAAYAGHMAAWQDAATLWDAKWQLVFGTVIPAAQAHLARHLNLPDPSTIAFAPNTHEFLRRLLSACPPARPARVLTTDGEFHTATRQFARLAEEGLVELTVVPVAPFPSFMDRWATAARGAFDLVLVSQVFFGSAWAVPDLEMLVGAVASAGALIAIDGYHGCLAVPTDLSGVAARAFYYGGGYKYMMAGEGVCFMHCPPGYAPRPRDTGWYASFGALAASRAGEVGYGTDGSRFMGATFDPSGLYRLNAVMGWLRDLGIDAGAVHDRAMAVQAGFVPALDSYGIPGLRAADILAGPGVVNRGNFLAYRSPSASDLHDRLTAAGVVTDRRGDALRIGFGLYHDPGEAPALAARVAAAATA